MELWSECIKPGVQYVHYLQPLAKGVRTVPIKSITAIYWFYIAILEQQQL